MRFRLDSQHYAGDKLLEPGQIVGDGEDSAHPWRYLTEIRHLGIRAGQAMAPSREMTPLDEEAKKAYESKFGTLAPDRDPTKAIPIQGTLDAKAPAQAPQHLPGQLSRK